MRYLFLTILMILLSSCSLWPWGSEKTGSCLDDDSCENADPLSQQLIGGTWYCYGSDRDQPWDCSQEPNEQKIVSIAPERNLLRPQKEQSELPETQQANKKQLEPLEWDNQSSEDNNTSLSMADLSSFSDESYTIQLVALQTIEDVQNFIVKHDIASAKTVMIRSQGEDWYVVLLGIYDSENRAQTIASKWQATHGPSSAPWVRTLGPLKRALVGR